MLALMLCDVRYSLYFCYKLCFYIIIFQFCFLYPVLDTSGNKVTAKSVIIDKCIKQFVLNKQIT